MRAWIYNRATALPGMPSGFAENAISSGAADNPRAPFLIISMGVEQPPIGMPASSRTQQIPFTVWVHDTPGSMLDIDDACVVLKNGLPTRDGFMVGGLSVYEVKWEDTGADAYDDHFKTNCRPVRFRMTTRR